MAHLAPTFALPLANKVISLRSRRVKYVAPARPDLKSVRAPTADETNSVWAEHSMDSISDTNVNTQELLEIEDELSSRILYSNKNLLRGLESLKTIFENKGKHKSRKRA